MGDLVKTSQQQVATRETNPFIEFGNTVSPKHIYGMLLKFVKGKWKAGEHQQQLPEGAQFVAVMDQAASGYIRWQDKRPTDQVFSLITSGGSPNRRDLGENDPETWPENDDKGNPKDPWQRTIYLPLVLVKAAGPFKPGEVFTFSSSSVSGIKSFGRFSTLYGKGALTRKDQYPVVSIKTSTFDTEKYGEIEFPDFPITGWVSDKAKFNKKLDEGDAVSGPAGKEPQGEIDYGVKSENPHDGFDDEIPF